jgi:ParB-like chromosome segregation protein Spo0J
MNQIEQKSVEDLIPYERNPKAHPDTQIEQLANSILEWGWTIPILVDEHNNVIAGHGRLYAAKHLGLEEVPCIVADGWSDEQKQAYVIADNKLAENSEWDMGLYFSELKKISDMGFDINLIGADVDLSVLNFSPDLAPSTSFADVTEPQIDRASEAMGQQIQNLGADRSIEGVEVMCPSCAHTFRFTGT